jgi:DNA-binding HxlR family transcriptional regulator
MPCCENVMVPSYSDAPLPVGLDGLVGMGMNRVKLAIVVALAAHGGSLTTPDLMAALGGELAGSTVARNLHELEDHGYVTGDLPREERRRRRTRWTLNHARLIADIGALVEATTPITVKTDVLP